MDVGDINVFYGSNGDLLYQRWDGEQWSEPAPMMAETVEVLSLKSRVKRLEGVLSELLALVEHLHASDDEAYVKALEALEDTYDR